MPGLSPVNLRANTLRRLLVEQSNAAIDRKVWLYHHYATSLFHQGERVVAVPYADNRLACYVFGIWSGTWPTHFGRIFDGCPAQTILPDDVSVTTTGSWVTVTDAQAFGGKYTRGGAGSVAGATKTATVNGTRVGLTLAMFFNAGTAIVGVDGDETNGANLLPTVTQALVDAGLFAQGDLGKRYVEGYKAGTTDYDQHFGCADGLANGNHTLSVRCTGLKRSGSTDTRVYLTAFWGGGPTTKLNAADPTIRIVYLKTIDNPRQGFSSHVNAVSYTPTGFTNYQFLGENHGNETLTSEQWYVDDVATTTVAGTLYSGKEISYDRLTTYNHPNASGCATRRVMHVARADTPMQLTARGSLVWNTAGTTNESYFGMLPIMQPVYDNSLQQTEFTHCRLWNGDAAGAVFAIPSTDDDTNIFNAKGDLIAAWSTNHDTVVLVHNPRMDLLLNQSIGTTFGQNRSDHAEKFYIARVESPFTETIAVGDGRSFECGWRVMRVPSASTRMAE